MDRDIALEALCALFNATVTSHQKQPNFSRPRGRGQVPGHQELAVRQIISTILNAEETSQVARSSFKHMKSVLQGSDMPDGFPRWQNTAVDKKNGNNFILDEEEFFDHQYDYDFTKLKDTEKYYRGGELYERPCGWQRFGLKVLNKYGENTWLGTQYRSTQSVPGEWPVSYHGTSLDSAVDIIEGFYKPGPRAVYGRGIYSTPYISEAIQYAKDFTSRKNGKKYTVILQNRINPKYRQIHNSGKYWLVPIQSGLSTRDEEIMAARAIRPYALLLKEV